MLQRHWLPSGSSDGRRAACPSSLNFNPHAGQRSLQSWGIDELRQSVGGVILAKDFVYAQGSGSDLVLEPQIGSGQVPNAAQPPSPAHAYGSCGIRMKAKSDLYPKVCAE